MKKKKIELKKLQLNKEKIVALTQKQIENVFGGVGAIKLDGASNFGKTVCDTR